MVIINNMGTSIKGNRIINAKGEVIATINNSQSVSIINGKILIDGKSLEEYEKESGNQVVVNVHVHGDCESIENCDEIHVDGNCGKIRTHNGEVRVGGDVTGSVSTHNGNINCGNVGGDVDTHNGNISYRR